MVQSPQSIHLIDTLREAGVNLESHEEPVGDQLAGKIFVLTGTLKRFTRDEAGAMIEAQGGKVSGSVFQEDLLCGGRRGGGLQAAQGPGAGHPGAYRGGISYHARQQARYGSIIKRGTGSQGEPVPFLCSAA